MNTRNTNIKTYYIWKKIYMEDNRDVAQCFKQNNVSL